MIGIFFGFAILGAIIGDPPEDQGTATTQNAAPSSTDLLAGTGEPDSEAKEDVSDWSYSENKDELRGSTDYFASVVSTNEVNFDFPYSGGSRLQITVRKSKAHGQDVIFSISDGQYVCGIYDCSGMISFDGAAEKLSLVPPADHDPKTLFAKFSDAIIQKLQSADKVIVELPFYQEGNRQFTFDTKNLKWNH